MRWEDVDSSIDAVVRRYRSMNPYQVLRVNPSATSDEVRKAYREMLLAYHPDRADPFVRSVNLEITKAINAAYEVIMRQRNEPK